MGYEIIKNIRITNNAVFITGASNNVWPRKYYTGESSFFSEILRTKGKIAVEKLILFEYLQYIFQGNDKYSFAVSRCLSHEKLNRKEEWDKCRDEDYKEQLLNKIYYYLKNPPQNQPCFIRNIILGYKLRSASKCRVTFNQTQYRIFTSIDAAQYFMGNKKLSLSKYEVVTIPAENTQIQES